MRALISYILILTFTCSSFAATQEDIRKGIEAGLVSLETNLSKAQSGIARLKQDKATLQVNLENMRNWGIAEQEEKLEYYNTGLEARQQLAEAKDQLTLKEHEHAAMVEKYHTLKRIACYVAGALFAALYLQLGAGVLAVAGALTANPIFFWVAKLLGPVAAFGLGYLLAYLSF
jgi:hypothetical protein